MVEQYLQHGRRECQQRGPLGGDGREHCGRVELPHDGNGHAVVQALKRNPDVQQMKIGQRIDETVAVAPFVTGLPMFAQAHTIDGTVTDHHAFRTTRGAGSVELNGRIVFADYRTWRRRWLIGDYFVESIVAIEPNDLRNSRDE